MFDELERLTANGQTVLFSSHSLEEVERLCQQVIIIREGRIVEQSQIDELRGRAGRHLDLVFRDPLPHLPTSIQVLERDGSRLKAIWTGETPELLRWLSSQSLDHVTIQRPDLSDLFRSYYREPPAPGGEESLV